MNDEEDVGEDANMHTNSFEYVFVVLIYCYGHIIWCIVIMASSIHATGHDHDFDDDGDVYGYVSVLRRHESKTKTDVADVDYEQQNLETYATRWEKDVKVDYNHVKDGYRTELMMNSVPRLQCQF